MLRTMILTALTFALALPLHVRPAHAADDPKMEALLAKGAAAILAEADKRHSSYEDQSMELKFTLAGGSDEGKIMRLQTFTAGERRAIRFVEPPDVKGMGVVLKGRAEMWVRLTGSRQIRRVASHARRQSFMGSDWSLDDFTLIEFGGDFDPSLKSKDAKHVILELKRKSSSDIHYKRLVVRVDRSNVLIDRIEYYSDGPKMEKLQTREKLVTDGNGHTYYTKIVMKTVKSGHSTTTDILSEKSNTGISKRTFSKRWLARGM